MDRGSSGTITRDFREALVRWKNGQDAELSDSLRKRVAVLQRPDTAALRARLAVAVLDVDGDDGSDVQRSIDLLERHLVDPSRAGHAWSALFKIASVITSRETRTRAGKNKPMHDRAVQKVPPFPWSAPPDDEVLRRMVRESWSDYGRDAEVLEWFLAHRGGAQVPAAAPVRRWIASLWAVVVGDVARSVPNAERLAGGTLGSPTGLAALCDLYAASLAAHAVRTIEARHAVSAPAFEVHGNFVRAELGGRDTSHPKRLPPDAAPPAFPTSLGTLLAAASCSRLGGAALTVFASGSIGLDVEWRDHDGTSIRVEAKVRAFASAFAPDATPESFVRWALPEIRAKAIALRQRTKADGADALQVVHLAAFVPVTIARALHELRWAQLVGASLAPEHPGMQLDPHVLPHAVIVHWIGIDAERGAVAAESLPQCIDVPQALPRPTASAIAAFHRAVRRPADAPAGLRART